MRIIDEGPVNTRPFFTLGQTKDKFRVVERRRGDVWITIVLDSGGTIDIRDFNITEDGFHVINGVMSDDRDYADSVDRSVYISPRRDCIYVDKKLDTTTNVGNVYRRQGCQAKIIRLDGQRFDDACVRWYCQQHRISFDSVTKGSGYTRKIFLMAWEHDHIGVFDISAANTYFPWEKKKENHSVFFRIYFDFARERFVRAHAIKPFR